MRTSHTIYKVPDGKMVRLEMDYDDKIIRISISGDFFMHPEDNETLYTANRRVLKSLPGPQSHPVVPRRWT